MRICGQDFSSDLLDRIETRIRQEPSLSRRKLSREICTWLDWRSPNGSFREMSCRKALAELHRRGRIALPESNRSFAFQKPSRKEVALELPDLSGTLSDLGELSVTPITSRYCKDSRLWRALLDRYHYLGSGQLCGAQLRYVIKSSVYGPIGALAFSSASWALRDRDLYIGWSEAARRANLKAVVNNSRFLIVPTVRVPNLASHLWSLTFARLADDWEARYHDRPVLVETFVDPRRFRGTAYRAANWELIGKTAGRRDGTPKMIFVHPLNRGWRKRLCAEPASGPGRIPRRASPAHWAEEEFGSVRFYDDRLRQRLYTIAQDFYNRPQANIPEACGSKARTIGAYRFFQNRKVTMDVLLTAHTEATIERIREHPVVLAPQDTTTLKYGTHPMTAGLGPVSHVTSDSIGLILHDTLAFTEDGTPLGVLDAQCWARDPEERGKKHLRHQRSIEEKESVKWLRSFRKVAEIQKLCPETTLVSIGDREADIYDLFLEAVRDPRGPRLLVRMEKTRNRQVEQQPLWDFMANRERAGSLKIHIPRRGSRRARDIEADLRFAEIELTPPVSGPRDAVPVTAWAVYLLEQEPEEGRPPVEWMLLTTAPVKSFDDAKTRVEWYTGRWGIEVYHRTLKSGCRIKDRQMGTADRLEACLGVDMVVAWRIYHLTMLGRETPEMPCTVFFKDIEWKALCCYVEKTPTPPRRPPNLKEAIRMVGAIGGHLGRKGDGPPGTQTLWRGLQRLDTATEMYVIFTQDPSPHQHKSGP